MRIAQSNSAGIVIGSPQTYFTWYCTSVFSQKNFLNDFRDSREDLAGNVREVRGSTRGTP